MEKVILTQKQADAIEIKVKDFGRDFTMNLHDPLKNDWINGATPLNELSNSELAKALYIGYEVEPEFKVGDWVYVRGIFEDLSPEVAKVTNVRVSRVVLDNGFDIGKGSVTPETLRHATPEEIAEEKERRWWAKHGREP